MRLHVLHRTVYRYDRPARYLVQSQRLTPVTTGSQRVASWAVIADGVAFGAAFTDGAGDRVVTMTHPGPVEAIEIRVEGVVETVDSAGVLQGHAEAIVPAVYLTATPPTAPNRAIAALRDRALAGAEAAPELERAHRLAAAVADAVVYTTGATHAQTTAAEALERGAGVCQDHAHVLIALARCAGLPARYVTGYLHGGGGEGQPYEASHAWAEIHVAGLGWVGFDAANRCCPDERYIRLASGRDARAAAPIRGIAGGQSAELMDVEVQVAQMGQSQSQSQ